MRLNSLLSYLCLLSQSFQRDPLNLKLERLEKEIKSLLKESNDKIDDSWKQKVDLNMQPAIGIVSQTIEAEMTDPAFDQYQSYIMSSYVKYFEAQGARVVPLLITQPDEEIFDLL